MSDNRISLVFDQAMFRLVSVNFQDEVRAGQAKRGPDDCGVQGDPLQGVPQGQAVAQSFRLAIVSLIGHPSNQPRAALIPGNRRNVSMLE